MRFAVSTLRATAFDGGEEQSTLISVGLPLLALMIVSAALYLARDVLIPLTAALILGVVLRPIAGRLERLVGRFFSAVVVLENVDEV
jgi:predicted PurR-regulated permease PerM